MRVLFLSNFYPPHSLGGQGESCREVVEELVRRGHQTAVLTSMHGTKNQPQTTGGIYRQLYLEVDLNEGKNWFNFFTARKAREAHNLQMLERAVSEFEPEVIFIWGMWNLSNSIAAWAEVLRPKQVLYRFADYWPTQPGVYESYWRTPGKNVVTRLPKRILGYFARLQLEKREGFPSLRYPHAVCVSAALRQTLVDRGVPIEHARVVHTGIKADEFLGDENVRSAEDTSTLKLVYAGRLSPEKGVETLIEALALLVKDGKELEVSLRIAGTGAEAYEALLHGLVREKDLSEDVVFLGWVSRKQMPDLLRGADILVVPSQWSEPFPRIVMEGMLCGAAVLASDGGGTPEIVQDRKNGALFTAGDAQDLAEKIAVLFEKPRWREQLARAGKQTVLERFTFEGMMDKIEEYLSEIANA